MRMFAGTIGSLWTVAGLEGDLVVLLVGPFGPARDPEFIIAPLYTDAHPGFRPTDEDLRLEPAETGLPSPVYAALWNCRPILQADLQLERGHLAEQVIVDLRDAYWAMMNEERPRGPRVGKPVRSEREPVVAFQLTELERWEPFSGRVMQRAVDAAPQLQRLAITMSGMSLLVTTAEMPLLLAANPRTFYEPPVPRAPGPTIETRSMMVAVPGDIMEYLSGRHSLHTQVVQVAVEMRGRVAANADYGLAA